MYRLLFRIVLVAIVAGIALGVIEVKFHLDKIGGAPAAIQQAIGDGSVISQVEYYFTTWKRHVEVTISSSNNKKFEIRMKHVEQDTKKLQDALNAKKDPGVIIVKSKLLNESLGYAKEALEDVSDEALKKLRDPWVKTLASANQELARLPALADEYKKYQEQIENIVPSPQISPKIELKF